MLLFAAVLSFAAVLLFAAVLSFAAVLLFAAVLSFALADDDFRLVAHGRLRAFA